MGIAHTGPDNICTAVVVMGNRRHRGKTSEQGWAHLNERIVDWPALDRKLVGKDIARDAEDNFRNSLALDLEIAEPGSLTDHLGYPLRSVADLDALSEKGWSFGIRAVLQPFLTC